MQMQCITLRQEAGVSKRTSRPTRKHCHECGFSSAVVTEESCDLTIVHIQRHTIDSRHRFSTIPINLNISIT